MTIADEALDAYADTLMAAGFTVYEPTGPAARYFRYSRVVDGQECFGVVQQEALRLQGYSHSMPIKPSKENGSSMFVDGVEDGFDALTVEAAETVAQPRNHNPLVGWQDNYDDPRTARMYTRRN